MRKRLLGLAVLAFGLAGVASAAAQTADQDESIVVQGRRALPPKAVHRYVAEISSSIDGQLSRFHDPVCPLVIGFPEDYNQRVTRRIRRIAVTAGVRVAGEKCHANMVAVISPDADGLVRDLRRTRPALFAAVSDGELKKAFRDGPVHMWNTALTTNEDGQLPNDMMLTVRSASIIDLPTQQVIFGSMMVIDDDAVIGKTLNQIADYIAMRALTGARPPRVGLEADTILTLFSPGTAAPAGLTQIDRSYLKGLYKTRPTMRRTGAMGRISGQIRRDAAQRAGTAK